MDTNQSSYSSSSKRNGHKLQPLGANYQSQPEKSDQEEMAKELGKIFAAARRRAILIIGVTIGMTAGIIVLLSRRPPNYQGKFELLVEPVTTSESKLQSLLSETEGNEKAIINGKDFSLDYESQIIVLLSPQLMNPITKNIQEKYPKITEQELISKINIERPFKENVGTRILEVSYKDKDPEKIRFVLEKIAQAYLNYSLQQRQSNIVKGIQFIEEKLPQMRLRVDTIQTELQKLRQNYNMLEPQIQGEVLYKQAGKIDETKLEIQAKLAENRNLYFSLQKLLDENNAVAILSREPLAYGQLLKQIYELDSEIAQKSTRYREDSAPIKILQEKQQSLRNLLLKEAKSYVEQVANEIKGLEARYQTISEAEDRVNKTIQQLPNITRRYDQLQQELKVANDSLKQLLVKRDTLRVDTAQRQVPWELIAPPDIPQDKKGRPIKEKTSGKTYILIALMGLALGIGAAVIVEVINNVFHAPEDLEEETKLPLLAIIPFSKEVKQLANKTKPIGAFSSNLSSKVASFTEQAGRYLVIINNANKQRYVDSPVVEAFRSLYTNIRLQSPDKPIQSLVIGSATPGDGKSSVAVHLAQTASAIGQRVLLVDADLRRPKIHTKLGLPNVRGLNDIISTDIGLNEVIQKSPTEENLFVLTAGSIPSDPIKLLSSEKMRHLMEQFQAFFDLIIYDTPPLVGLADANLVAAYTDGLVMVVGLEKTDRFMVLKSLDRLSISGVDVLGLVANGVKGYKTKVYKAYQRV